jgi:hypothetical protein
MKTIAAIAIVAFSSARIVRRTGSRWPAPRPTRARKSSTRRAQLRPMPAGVSASDLNGAVQQRLIGKSRGRGSPAALRSMTVHAHGRDLAGSAVTYDGLQIASEQLLGISGGTRFNLYNYDARGRLASSVAAKAITALEAT